ncbi:MAG: THUMP domain-containing protein [Candidatus Bathyarchaeota archaeon]|nr:THUMP domain-containing protein [Candidatus Bathyarchaeota archaeon]
MAKLFFLLSGENPTLPFSEVKSILSAEGYNFRVLSELTQLLRVEADIKCAKAVGFRSALAKGCCLELFNCEAGVDEILSNARKIDFTQFLGEGESFAVRVIRVRGCAPHISCLALERSIGEIIFGGVDKARVNLKNPDKTFEGVLVDNMFFFGLRLVEIKHKDLLERGPRRRVFFHPSAMTAKIARCMVNLAQARAGNLLLDPFCGTGSILIEAGLIGCRIIGFDVKRRMVEGSLKNLRFFSVDPETIAVADACIPPLSAGSVDRIATDPPYGTTSSTLGSTTRNIVERFFSSARNIIRDGGMICIAAPKDIKVHEIGQKHGFKHLESHFVYVHRRLTREISIFKYAEG